MRLTSSAFEDGDFVPWRHSAAGLNELPPMEIDDVPAEARSLVVMIEDADSPLGEGVTHWLAWNLPPDTRLLDATHRPPECCVGMDSFGKVGYMGPIPLEGRHYFRFRVLALDTELDLASGATRDQVDKVVQGHVIDEAEMTGVVEEPDTGDD